MYTNNQNSFFSPRGSSAGITKIESWATFSPEIQKSRNPGIHLFREPTGDNKTKTNEEGVVDEEVVVEAETATNTVGLAIPTASTNNMITSRRRTCWVIFRRFFVAVGIPPIGTPVIDISSHVVESVAVWRKAFDRRGSFPDIFASGSFVVCIIVRD